MVSYQERCPQPKIYLSMLSSWILPLAAIGLVNSLYILSKKLTKQKLTCFIQEDCDKVVKSKYGYLLGIPNEVIGIGYYLFFSGMFWLGMSLLAQIAAALALIASIVLVGIQAFILKQWCEYCLLASLINLLIFILVL